VRTLLFAVACAILGGWADSSAFSEPLQSALVEKRARLAAEFMAQMQLPNGLFEYEYDFLRGGFTSGNNIVRQAGATAVLGEYASFSGNAAVAESAGAAIAALAALSVAYEGGAVVSTTDLPKDGNTGATALSLLAELHYFAATGDTRFQDSRRGWLRALSQLQLPSGGFAQAPETEVESSYFNGEAWLALAEYARPFPTDAAAASVLKKADSYLMTHYGAEPNPQFAHWGLMAASVRYHTTGESRFLDFLALLSEAFLTDLRPEFDPARNGCSAVEGLAAAARALSKGRQHNGLVERIRDRVELELSNSLELQIMPGQERIHFGGERFLVGSELAGMAGAFLNGRFNPRARIDTTQHCLSALMKYAQFRS